MLHDVFDPGHTFLSDGARRAFETAHKLVREATVIGQGDSDTESDASEQRVCGAWVGGTDAPPETITGKLDLLSRAIQKDDDNAAVRALEALEEHDRQVSDTLRCMDRGTDARTARERSMTKMQLSSFKDNRAVVDRLVRQMFFHNLPRALYQYFTSDLSTFDTYREYFRWLCSMKGHMYTKLAVRIAATLAENSTRKGFAYHRFCIVSAAISGKPALLAALLMLTKDAEEHNLGFLLVAAIQNVASGTRRNDVLDVVLEYSRPGSLGDEDMDELVVDAVVVSCANDCPHALERLMHAGADPFRLTCPAYDGQSMPAVNFAGARVMRFLHRNYPHRV